MGRWVAGSIALRIIGVLLIFLSLWGLVREIEPFLSALVLVVGLLLWLAGHWLYAYREHEYAGPLVERIFLQALPRRLDPTRHWSYRVHHTHTHYHHQVPPPEPPTDRSSS
jgi:predicted membrane channel-forming protein YqfA (hemolysin III family)